MKSVSVFVFFVQLAFGDITAHDNDTSYRTGSPRALGRYSFVTYWNIPTFQCISHGFNFTELARKFHVVQNKKDSFRGEKIVILYDPGAFPAILTSRTGSKLVYRNGGVPQQGNLTMHLTLFDETVDKLIPNKEFSGIGVIDFESWRPIFRQNFGTLDAYKEMSIEIEKQNHPFWLNVFIEKEAQRRFEMNARIFMEETLQLAKRLRPNATWGYYAYPYCFNMSPNNMNAQCSNEVKKENERTQWLFDASDNLYPSLYLRQQKLSQKERVQLIQGRIEESHRIIGLLNKSRQRQILPYFWYRYQDSEQFLTKEDLFNSFHTLRRLGIDGLVLWGSSNDVNNKTKCEVLYKYIENVLGPALVSW